MSFWGLTVEIQKDLIEAKNIIFDAYNGIFLAKVKSFEIRKRCLQYRIE